MDKLDTNFHLTAENNRGVEGATETPDWVTQGRKVSKVRNQTRQSNHSCLSFILLGVRLSYQFFSVLPHVSPHTQQIGSKWPWLSIGRKTQTYLPCNCIGLRFVAQKHHISMSRESCRANNELVVKHGCMPVVAVDQFLFQNCPLSLIIP